MQFAMYLVDSGVITCEEFFEVLKLQMQSRPKLGALAIKRRMLTCRQVFQVLEAQCNEPLEFFGELAKRMGFITAEQFSLLLGEQQTMTSSIRDVLVDNGRLTPPRLTGMKRSSARRCAAPNVSRSAPSAPAGPPTGRPPISERHPARSIASANSSGSPGKVLRSAATRGCANSRTRFT
jgi:hypothetical protein